MKKFKSILVALIAVLAVSLFISPSNSEAATSSWKSVKGAGSACKVRVWTDANTYTKRATSVDFTLEQNGKCGRLNYDSHLAPRELTSYNVPSVKGYFNNKTPVKKLSVQLPVFKNSYNGYTATVYSVLFKNGKEVGRVESNVINIHKQ